jgi:hypothetical protein
MADTPTAPTCVCGSALWTKHVHPMIVWCRRCGAVREVFSGRWQIPLDRAGDLPTAEIPDEPPTKPGKD